MGWEYERANEGMGLTTDSQEQSHRLSPTQPFTVCVELSYVFGEGMGSEAVGCMYFYLAPVSSPKMALAARKGRQGIHVKIGIGGGEGILMR